ncbi:MAG: helix-turn-helix transcriptional regulator [Butyrivibrio sp.]|nr:helix-turn-helix transcriptional regulator [Butyrivibrio sp.]
MTGFDSRAFPAHWHSYGEIILVGSGDTNIYQINQKTYHLQPGDLVLIWPTEMHEIVGADRSQALVIQFSNALISFLFDFQRIIHYYHDLHVIRAGEVPRAAERLRNLALRMRDTWLSDTIDREIRCCMLLMEFMLRMDEYRDELSPQMHHDRRTGGERTDVATRRLIDVTDFIKTHLADEDLSLRAMAEMAGVSQEHFSRTFKHFTGQTYNSWLNMIRLEKAISLFASTSMSLTEIAMLSGFQSIPTFNRVFRNAKGMSPGTYRSRYVINHDTAIRAAG